MAHDDVLARSPLTGNPARLLFQETVLGKYVAHYYLDERAGYIFVNQPSWLDEAYSSAIAITDTGILARNTRNIQIISRALARPDLHFEKGVDLGGGYGLFVRGMRDAGFEFFWTDKYATNLVAREFEAGADRYTAAVAFEVLEHIQNPLLFLQDAQREFGFNTCFFSATCFDERNIPGTDWWYWGFETGQHISFFSERTLRWMAAELGMKLWHIEQDVYAFSTLEWKALPDRLLERIWTGVERKVRRGLFRRPARRSLTMDDHLLLRHKLRKSHLLSGEEASALSGSKPLL